MKEFMMIFIGGDYTEADLSPQQMEQRMAKWMSWVEQLTNDGHYIDGKPLEPVGKRVAGSEQVVTDGPFVESKELVGGYFIVKAKDINEAVQLTGGFPDYDLGGQVEVRPIMVY